MDSANSEWDKSGRERTCPACQLAAIIDPTLHGLTVLLLLTPFFSSSFRLSLLLVLPSCVVVGALTRHNKPRLSLADKVQRCCGFEEEEADDGGAERQ